MVNRTQMVSQLDYFISVQYTVQMRKKKSGEEAMVGYCGAQAESISHAVLPSLGRRTNGQW